MVLRCVQSRYADGTPGSKSPLSLFSVSLRFEQFSAISFAAVMTTENLTRLRRRIRQGPGRHPEPALFVPADCAFRRRRMARRPRHRTIVLFGSIEFPSTAADARNDHPDSTLAAENTLRLPLNTPSLKCFR